ncbi:hypothetical protein HanXRQr2_Chr04g0173461 [Helianthus annuus]|uniref:Uncharacterized protein n=1 Tax=Helianthus annuus TaxID=4232 RepID=A0A9K3J9H3_HELAN|nr:hypothetical protein HanXRQr2_Chr04g0173461 [Helianthus annuus]KAJ0931891.1 hypothetical protein HanPSC8_Chr04g0167181 [Helianthus annuus]
MSPDLTRCVTCSRMMESSVIESQRAMVFRLPSIMPVPVVVPVVVPVAIGLSCYQMI